MIHPCRTCDTPVTGLRVYCDSCRIGRAKHAAQKQTAQRREMYDEIDIDRIPRVVGVRAPEGEMSRGDLEAFDMALSRFLVSVGG